MHIPVAKISTTMSSKNDLLLLFDRPKERLFSPKGDEGKVFEVPPNLLVSYHYFLLLINLNLLFYFTNYFFAIITLIAVG